MKRVATPEEVWASIKELTDAQKASREESIRRQQEWDRKFEQERQESIRRQQESDRAFKQRQEEWDRKFEQQQKENAKRLKWLENLFVGQWGKLMEQLVKGDFIKLLNQRNIKVERLDRITSGIWNDKPYEFDIIAVNGSEVVVAEVKTTLNVGHVDDFMEKLNHFKEMYPPYRDKKVYGAVAYLKVNEGADVYAERAGLFVIRAVGSSSSLINKQNFVPKIFG